MKAVIRKLCWSVLVVLSLVCLLARPASCQSRAEQRAGDAISRLIHDYDSVASVRAFPVGKGRKLWAAVVSEMRTDTLPPSSELVLYRKTRAGFKPTQWRVKLDDQSNGAVSVLRLSGRALPEIAVRGIVVNRPDVTRYLTVFEYRPQGLRELFGIASNGDIGIVDLRHDGRREIVDYGEAGLTPSGVTQPHGAKVSVFRGGKFVSDRAAFPGVFTAHIRLIEKGLQGDPDNYPLRHRLAYFYAITGKQRESEALYQQAERLCRTDLQAAARVSKPSPEAKYWKELTLSELKQIESRDADL